MLEAASKLYRRAVKDDVPDVALVAGAYAGTAACLRGDNAEGVAWFQKALLAGGNDVDPVLRSSTLGDLGNAYRNLGQLTQAVTAYTESVELADRCSAERLVVSNLSNLSTVYHDLGNEEAELAALERARIKARQSNLGDLLAYVNINLASLYERRGDARGAIALLQDAGDVLKQVGDLRGYAVVLGNIGKAHAALGDQDEAIRFYQEGLRLAEISGNVPVEANISLNLAALLLEAGQRRPASDLLDRGVRLSRRLGEPAMLMRGLTSLAELEENRQHQTEAIGLLTEAADIGENLRRQYQRPEEGSRIQWRLAGIYGRLVRLHATRGQATDAFLCAERARATLLLRSLAERPAAKDVTRDAEMRLNQWAAPTLDNVLSALRLCGRRAALISYFLANDQLYAFVIRSSRIRVEMVICDLATELAHEIVTAFDAEVAGPRPTVTKETWQQLSEIIISPLRAMLDPEDTLLIVPHGFLHHLPLHALNVDGVRLIERWPVAYLPAASALPYLTDPDPTAPRKTVVVGAHFTGEANDVADLLKADKTLIGPQVKKQSVLQALPSADVIHISAHGFFDQDRPRQSGWILQPSPEIIKYIEEARTGTRSLWQLVTAEAAANAVVTVEDLRELRLHARLVTMSACESGLMQTDPADDPVGLIPALLSSGVRGVLGSLWKVDPSVTRDLMTTFYSQLQRYGWGNRPRAFQTAMLNVMRERPHPYFWAPFILVGGMTAESGSASYQRKKI